MPYFLRMVCGFFYVPESTSSTLKGCETGRTVYRQNDNEETLSSVVPSSEQMTNGYRSRRQLPSSFYDDSLTVINLFST